jgi:hypothetical protein
MTKYSHFRQRLDAILRTLDVRQVADFLIAEGQWSQGKPADPEFAMWLMIAGNPALEDLHAQARDWLESHGHATEARTFLTNARGLSARSSSKKRRQK